MAIDTESSIILDTKGLSCPMPLLKAKQQLNKLISGDVLLIEATDAGSVRDFQVFADQSGHILMKQTDDEGVFRHWIKKI